MWICLNNSFLSIIDPKAAYKGGNGPVSPKLLVRARIKGDIERVFPKAKVERTPERDYLFRALIDRQAVANTIADAVAGIDYLNFKGSTPEKFRHDAYAGFWSIMNQEQNRQSMPRRAQKQKGEDFFSGWPEVGDRDCNGGRGR